MIYLSWSISFVAKVALMKQKMSQFCFICVFNQFWKSITFDGKNLLNKCLSYNFLPWYSFNKPFSKTRCMKLYDRQFSSMDVNLGFKNRHLFYNIWLVGLFQRFFVFKLNLQVVLLNFNKRLLKTLNKITFFFFETNRANFLFSNFTAARNTI